MGFDFNTGNFSVTFNMCIQYIQYVYRPWTSCVCTADFVDYLTAPPFSRCTHVRLRMWSRPAATIFCDVLCLLSLSVAADMMIALVQLLRGMQN